MNSGSRYSDDSLMITQDLVKYIDETKSTRFSMTLLTSNLTLSAPRRFYTRATYVLSPLPVKLAERFALRGLKLPEYLLSWYHSVIQ